MKTFYLRIFYLSFFSLLQYACSSDDDQTDQSEEPEQFIIAKINNVPFKNTLLEDMNIYYSEAYDDHENVIHRNMGFSGRDDAGNTLRLDIAPYTGSGTYTFSPDDPITHRGQYFSNDTIPNPVWNTNIAGGEGSIFIQELEDNFAEGTFSFKCYNHSEDHPEVVVTNGQFFIKIPKPEF